MAGSNKNKNKNKNKKTSKPRISEGKDRVNRGMSTINEPRISESAYTEGLLYCQSMLILIILLLLPLVR